MIHDLEGCLQAYKEYCGGGGGGYYFDGGVLYWESSF